MKVKVIEKGWRHFLKGRGRERDDNLRQTHSQPAGPRLARQLTDRRQPASRAPDTASSQRPQSFSQQKSHRGLLGHFPTLRSQDCATVFCLPDLTNYTQQNHWIFSKCYLPPVTWQRATGDCVIITFALIFVFLK